MLEYEGILQKQPDNAEVIAALGEVEERLAKERPGMPDKPAPATNRGSGIDLDFRAVVITATRDAR